MSISAKKKPQKPNILSVHCDNTNVFVTSTSKEGEPTLTCRYGCMALRQASGMFSLLKCIKESRNVSTLAIITFAAFQLRSFGTLPPGAIRTMTAAVTLVTANTGEPKDFNSVRLFWMTGEEGAVKWMLRGGVGGGVGGQV